MFLTDNKRLLDKSDDLTPDSIKFLREQIADETIKKAAPTLLEALEELLECPELAYSYTHGYVIKARAAIAAARGE